MKKIKKSLKRSTSARRSPARRRAPIRIQGGRAKSSKAASPKRASAPSFGRADLANFRKLLLKKKQTLMSEIDHISRDALSRSQRDATGELSGYTFHQADVATDNYDREFSLGLATTEQKIIWEIDEAIGRVQDRTFGICLECNKRIGRRRLQALPYARCCIDCQKKEEIPS